MALGFLSTGCGSFLTIEISPQLIESNNLLSSEKTAQSAVDGVFTDMRTSMPSFLNGTVTIFAGMAGDELEPSSNNATYLPFYSNALLPANNTLNSQFWRTAYHTLYRCNALIAGLRSNTTIPQRSRERLLGELLVVRAFHFNYLVLCFGDVPLVLSTDYTINATLGRTAYQEVFQQIVTDLSEARQLLQPSIDTGTKTRPGYWAATALLARINLYLGNHVEAANYAGEVIEGPFTLERELESIFQIGKKETIWEIAAPLSSGNTAEAGAFLPASPTSISPVLLTSSVTELFEPQDFRLIHWVGASEGPEGPVYFARKYTMRQAGDTHEYLVALRLAEQYLIRAEALHAIGESDLAHADLNTLRDRANASQLDDAISKDMLWNAIYDERFRELFAEWGHRWYDLRRWGVIDDIMSKTKPHWKPYMALFPIPETQIRYNYKLTQNQGY